MLVVKVIHDAQKVRIVERVIRCLDQLALKVAVDGPLFVQLQLVVNNDHVSHGLARFTEPPSRNRAQRDDQQQPLEVKSESQFWSSSMLLGAV